MNARLVTRSRMLSVQWHLFQGREQVTVAEEARESLLLDDGTWLQTCRLPDDRRSAVPDRFVSERRRWRRFIRAHRLWDAQLRYLEKSVTLPGPPPRHYPGIPEWTLYLSIPVRRFGSWIFTHTTRSSRLPFRRLVARIRALSEVPDMDLSTTLDDPIAFDGDALISFCRRRIERLADHGGHWRDLGPHHPLPVFDKGEHVLLPETLLPRSLRFVPDQRVNFPEGCWHALALDPDSGRLLLMRGQGGQRAYKTILLRQPLHRLFGGLRFGHRLDRLVIDDTEYQVPVSFLEPGEV